MSCYFTPAQYTNLNFPIEIFKVLVISIDGFYTYQGVLLKNLFLKYGKVIDTSFHRLYTPAKNWYIWNFSTVFWNHHPTLMVLRAWKALIFSTSQWTNWPLSIWYQVALYWRGWHWWTSMASPFLIFMHQISFSLMLEVCSKMSVSRIHSTSLLFLLVCMLILG